MSVTIVFYPPWMDIGVQNVQMMKHFKKNNFNC